MRHLSFSGIRLLGFKPRTSLRSYHNIKPSNFVYPAEDVWIWTVDLLSPPPANCPLPPFAAREREQHGICGPAREVSRVRSCHDCPCHCPPQRLSPTSRSHSSGWCGEAIPSHKFSFAWLILPSCRRRMSRERFPCLGDSNWCGCPGLTTSAKSRHPRPLVGRGREGDRPTHTETGARKRLRPSITDNKTRG
jgi:hypothetical protein